MKFAKQLKHERVPEWIDYYLNYKLGKKKIKQYGAAKRRGVPYPSRDIDDFFQSELVKVENFYKHKEGGAVDRILELKSQFNIYQEQLFLRGSVLQQSEDSQDYTRPKVHRREARKKLKQALVEFYRGLELLQAFAALNSTAFRKLNKKLDKTVQTDSRPLLRYYNDDVQHAHFFKSKILDQIIVEVEELYAKHYEQGNHKAAVDELKAKSSPDWQALSWAMFANGIFSGLGATLAILGLIHACTELQQQYSPQSSFLLQLFGGYFLMLLLMVLFGLGCCLFDQKRINYQFIFNLNTYQSLNWREILVLPSLFFFFFGICIYAAFAIEIPSTRFRLFSPAILVGSTLGALIVPVPAMYGRSRRWFLKHVVRLAASPFMPVFFPDFFIGDMFCSLSYSMSNIEVFFCLYANHWNDVQKCNSNNSRLLGFLTALPAVWRALQCLRRFYDTRAIFPHLANFGKYTATCLAYACLSIYRIDRTFASELVYIAFATINSLYTIFWDIRIDWSLGELQHKLLRQDLAFDKSKWLYYAAIVWDVLIRCNWVAYVAVNRFPQHSSLASFLVALTEVIRRGVWSIIRVENEHWGNVRLTTAYRDPPLPYKTPDPAQADGSAATSGADLERTGSKRGVPMHGLRRRRSSYSGTTSKLSRLNSTMSVLNDVHMQDYSRGPERSGSDGSSDDEEE